MLADLAELKFATARYTLPPNSEVLVEKEACMAGFVFLVGCFVFLLGCAVIWRGARVNQIVAHIPVRNLLIVFAGAGLMLAGVGVVVLWPNLR